MENDRDLRNVVLLLVKAHKKELSRSQSLNKLVFSIMAFPPNKRAELTTAEVQSIAHDLRTQTDALADKLAAQVEAELSGDEPFLEALRVYASKQFWTG